MREPDNSHLVGCDTLAATSDLGLRSSTLHKYTFMMYIRGKEV